MLRLQRRALVGVICVASLLCPAVMARSARKLSFRDLDGNKVRISEFEGKIVVLNFWATWCGPCREELPRLEQIASQYSGQRVAFVLVSIDEGKRLPDVKQYVSDHQLHLPVWVGGSVDNLEDLTGSNVVPGTVVLDEHGEVVRAINGEAREEDVREAVAWLLAGRNGAPPALHVKRY